MLQKIAQSKRKVFWTAENKIFEIQAELKMIFGLQNFGSQMKKTLDLLLAAITTLFLKTDPEERRKDKWQKL